MFQCGGGTIASAADSHTGANNADLIVPAFELVSSRIIRISTTPDPPSNKLARMSASGRQPPANSGLSAIPLQFKFDDRGCLAGNGTFGLGPPQREFEYPLLKKMISSSDQSSRNQDDDYDIRLSKLSLISLIQHSTPYTRPDLTFSLLL